MGFVRNIAIAVLVFSFLVFVVLFGRIPTFRNTPIGFLNRLLRIHIPGWAIALDNALTGGRVSKGLARTGHFLLYEKHPLVLIAFLGLLTSASGLFLYNTWHLLAPVHHFVVVPILFAPYFFTYKSAASTASQISAATLDQNLSIYPFDYTIFYPSKICATCRIIKPARSKHCSICNACIARSDHHCAWINNCVGRDNYRWFYGLLTSLGILLNYGAYLSYRILAVELWGSWYARMPPIKISMILDGASDVLAHNSLIGSIGLLALLTSPLAWGLWCYHTYLIWAGMTTNETGKWSDLKEDMAEGYIWKSQRHELFKQTPPPSWLYDRGPFASQWPIRSEQVILRSENGQAPNIGDRPGATEGLGSWERCWHLGQVVNLYDLGTWDNLLDALQLL